MTEFDLVVRGGTVIDGTGAAARTADVAVRGGEIVEVGTVSGTGDREISADGAVVCPGFVDIHTHYDGQAVWDERLVPSSLHGVTSVVLGNCGVGFAPLRGGDDEVLIEMMEGIEDIPGSILRAGLPWGSWETFPEFMDALERRRRDVDIAVQVPHAPLRRYVMGDRARAGVDASPDDIREMGRLAAEGVSAGALGFSSSRSANHKSSKGVLTPTVSASQDELVGIGTAIAATGQGVLQLLSDFQDVESDFEFLKQISKRSGLPLSFTISQLPSAPQRHRVLTQRLATANAEGVRLRGQIAPRSTGIVLGLDCTLNPFVTNPVYREIEHEDCTTQAALMRDPEFRRRVLDADSDVLDTRIGGSAIRRFAEMFELSDPPNYEPDAAESIANRAAARGISPAALVYDVLSAGAGTAKLYVPLSNFVGGNLQAVREMLESPHTVIGLSDGGAHVGSICDASFPTTLLTLWGRDRAEGTFPLEYLIARQTRMTAETVGLLDRGVLAPGFRADINVIDMDRLQAHVPEVSYDLPAGGRRLVQRASGYLHSFVRGVQTYASGEWTGELPGQLIRGKQQPSASVR